MMTIMNETRRQALDIWEAGVSAVDSARLVRQVVTLQEGHFNIGKQTFPLDQLGKVVVVGAGKAGAGMAAGLEAALPESFLKERVTGWVNVPADCIPPQPLQQIHLHAARPAGVNEPTQEGMEGTFRILELVSSLQPNDLCVVLISGGGSALLPAPVEGITLQDKLFVTRQLSKSGATIEELNLVRRALSRVKGGGLARACRSEKMISLIISDVVGDPLHTIASGPTVTGKTDRKQALSILKKYLQKLVPPRIETVLLQPDVDFSSDGECEVFHQILGSNSIAIQAAGQRAEELGYRVLSLGSNNTGAAAEFGRHLVRATLEYPFSEDRQPLCLLCGGETTVSIEAGAPFGKGGRNQEVALAAIQELQQISRTESVKINLTLLAAGTDGEDGPTDAAGGFADQIAIEKARELNLSLPDYLHRHDAYHFLSQCQSLLITGPTHTNVMDLAVVLVHPTA